MSKIYSIYEAKAKLSELLRIVKTGKEVVVSERGTPIAKIVPLLTPTSFDHRFNQLKQSGQLSERKKGRFSSRVEKMEDEKSGVLKRFLEDRD